MASRPAHVVDKSVVPSSFRKRATGKSLRSDARQSGEITRSVTIHWDVAAIIRGSMIGLAAVLFAVATLVVALRGGTNYPMTTGIQAIGNLDSGDRFR